MILDDVAEEMVLEDVETEAPVDEEISLEPEDMMDASLAEEPTPEVPVEEAIADEEIDLLMDEPEAEPVIEDVLETSAEEDALTIEADDGVGVSDLAGLDQLEDEDDIEDMDSLLDNVEVDVSDVVADEIEIEAGVDGVDDIDDIEIPDMDVDTGLTDMLTEEAMPHDAGVDVSDDVDVDQLLADVRTEAGASTVADLQGKVALLEARVEDLENRLREEIAQLVPAEAARIIREEIAALAQELGD